MGITSLYPSYAPSPVKERAPMSVEKINLRKLLGLFYADRRDRRRILVADVRNERNKDENGGGDGGDFHGPFWADAKDHVAGKLDLREQSEVRVASNKARARLYPLLTEGFLNLWNERIQWRNEKFETYPISIKAQLRIEELNAIVKIENVVAVKIPDGSSRIVYPYFGEKPALPIEGARLGLWALKEALIDFRAEDFRIIDILRRSYFRPAEISAQGNERELFVQKYRDLLEEWRKLR
jgi:hypothetical protein